ncbi:MAG: hypothetical protein JKY85_04525 [Porticoccus sp.]|nr:hypothetical protein [Porticoccus sp.]
MKFLIQVVVFFILGSIQTWADTTEQTIEKPKEQSVIDWSSPNDIKKHMVYKLMPIKGEGTFAPNLALSNSSLSENFSEIYLARTENFDDGEIFTLFVTALYNDTDWHNYTGVSSPRADDLSFTALTKKEHGCDNKNLCKYEENLSIEIGFIEIIDSLTTSLDLTLTGTKNHHIKIPGSYLLAIMRTIRSE